jgi:hypothetical protein
VSFLAISPWICLKDHHGGSGVVVSAECDQRRYSALSAVMDVVGVRVSID